MTNIFTINSEQIPRRMNPLSTYISTNALYLSKKYNVTIDIAERVIKDTINKKGFNNPSVYLYEKDLATLDKKETTMSLSRFLSTVTQEKMTIAPSFTCYTKVKDDGSEWRSMHAKMLNINKKMRSYHKSLSKEAKSKGNLIEADIQKTIDASKKMSNNGYSGASCQLHSPLATHSSHYTFTSATRVSTSTANLVTESMVMGYRSYYSPNDVLLHWNAIIHCYDKETVQIAVDTYQLHIPTHDDIMDMVVYSKYHYWHNDKEEDRISDYVNKLSDLDKVAIMYTFDLFHIIKLNQSIMNTLIDNISVVRPSTYNDYSIVEEAEEYKINLMYHILSDRLVGKGLDLQKHKGTELGSLISSTLYNIDIGLKRLQQMSNAFFKSEVLPINIATYKKAIRRGVSLSDTDSSNGMYSRLRNMRFGKENKHNVVTIGYVSALSTIVSEVVVNALSILTKSMNVDDDKAHELSMKSEFYFPLFAPTTSSKHYLTISYIVEMLIEANPETEFHGVALLSNNISKDYNDVKQKIANMIRDAVMSGITINPVSLIQEVKELEKNIETRVLNLDSDVLVFSDIKDASSYKNPASSPYFHYELYCAVFEEKYGACPKPPIVSVNLPLMLGSKNKIADYIRSIPDEKLSARFAEFIEVKNKKMLNTIKLPLESIVNSGLPEELVPIIDTKKIILSQTHSIRAVLDILGIPSKDGYLISECYI